MFLEMPGNRNPATHHNISKNSVPTTLLWKPKVLNTGYVCALTGKKVPGSTVI